MFIIFQMSPGPAAPGAPVAGGWAGLARARWCGGHLLPAQSVPDPCRVVTTGLSMAFHGPSYGLSRECAMKVRPYLVFYTPRFQEGELKMANLFKLIIRLLSVKLSKFSHFMLYLNFEYKIYFNLTTLNLSVD